MKFLQGGDGTKAHVGTTEPPFRLWYVVRAFVVVVVVAVVIVVVVVVVVVVVLVVVVVVVVISSSLRELGCPNPG